MNGSKSFGVRMPLEMYLKMVEVCSKNGVTQTDLVLYALNRVGLFTDNFKFGGEAHATPSPKVVERIVYKNEPEMVEELKKVKQSLQNYISMWKDGVKQGENWERESKNLNSLLASREKEISKLKNEIEELKPKNKPQEDKFKIEKEIMKRERANKPYYDENGKVRFYDKNGDKEIL